MTISINDTTMMSSAIMASDSIDTITLTGTGSSPTYTISSPGNVSGGLYWGLNSGSSGQALTSNGTNTSNDYFLILPRLRMSEWECRWST